MKNLKIILIGISLILIIVSCTKSEDDTNKSNNKICYKCTQNTTVKYNGLTIGGSSLTAEFCNQTQSEIEKLQQDSTYFKTNGEITESTTFKCELKK